ncbi:ribonuclease HII [Bacteriovoracaceae bacterium]|nr:ribonuclease HII [Bacteriovoracaceae bacterium]
MASSFFHSFLKNYQYFLGVDEVGRGPLAGPVISCAFSLSHKDLASFEAFSIDNNVTDSKKLSAKKRAIILEELNVDLAELIPHKVYKTRFGSFALGSCDHNEIDKINILQASLKSMVKASSELLKSQKLNLDKTIVLIDGNKKISLPSEFGKVTQETIVKGDSKCCLISIASIIAKEYRDALMVRYDEEYPGYNLGKHAGYPTVAHKLAIQTLGPSKIHRASFRGVKEYINHENSSL